ncbi:MAG TPA: hypothetical protein DIS62_06630 [Candidatus Kerfeldbacteria bacterium]|nr:hypothetical protein [Candidatus Kerfeldbacteria bacterium]
MGVTASNGRDLLELLEKFWDRSKPKYIARIVQEVCGNGTGRRSSDSIYRNIQLILNWMDQNTCTAPPPPAPTAAMLVGSRFIEVQLTREPVKRLRLLTQGDPLLEALAQICLNQDHKFLRRLCVLHRSVIRPVDVNFNRAIYRVAGSALEWTKRFWNLLFAEWAEYIELNEPIAHQDDQTGVTYDDMPLFVHVVTRVAVVNEDDRHPEKRVLLMLIEHCESDDTADKMLEGIVALLCSRTSNIFVMVPKPERLEEVRFDFENPTLVLSSSHAAQIGGFLERKNTLTLGREEDAQKFMRWFESHQPEITRACEQKQREIRVNTHYGLRCGGRDCISVSLSPLRRAGIMGIAFHPENHVFPDAGIEVTVFKEGATPCHFKAELVDLSLVAGDHIFYSHTQVSIPSLRRLLELVVIEAMHYFCVIGQRASHDRAKSMRGTRPSAPTHVDGVKTTSVRPHMMRLPQNKRARPDKHARAHEEMGWSLPSHITYVTEHMARIGGIESDPTPAFTCRDQLFQFTFSS